MMASTADPAVLAPFNTNDNSDINDDDDDFADSWDAFFTSASSANTGLRDADLEQSRDLDLILTERAERFYDPKLVGVEKEKCILVAVDTKLEDRRAAQSIDKHGVGSSGPVFSLKESLSELSELVGTAGLQVMASCVQRRYTPHTRTYIGPGKVHDVMAAVNATDARTLVIDDDLSTRQQVPAAPRRRFYHKKITLCCFLFGSAIWRTRWRRRGARTSRCSTAPPSSSRYSRSTRSPARDSCRYTNFCFC
jgi:GTP-binding GTPase N-terminal